MFLHMRDLDCFSPSLMHLDDGEVDLISHFHVPALNVQSHVPYDVLSNCKGHAAAVSSHWSSATGKNDCISGLMPHGSHAPMTLCGLPLGLLESQLLDASQMQWSPAFAGAEVCHARTTTKVFEVCPNDSSSGTSSTRQATVESDFLSTPMLVSLSEKCWQCQKSLEELARQVARVQGQPRWAKRRTAKTSTKTGHYLFRSSHG